MQKITPALTVKNKLVNISKRGEVFLQNDIYLEKIKKLTLNFMKNEPLKIYLFGSWGRGEQNKSSDVDIAVEYNTKSDRTKIALLRELFEESAIPYRVDVVDLQFVSDTLRKEILKEGLLWTA